MLITTKVSEYGYDLEIKGQSQIFLKNCHAAHNTNSFLVYSWDVFLFSTSIAYDVQIKTNVSDS